MEPVTRQEPEVVACSAYAGGRKTGDVVIEDISEVVGRDGQFVWIGLYEPGSQLMGQIREEFDLHELAVEDALRAHQRPKVEEYGDSLFVVLRTAHLSDDKVVLGETHVFLGPHYLVTVRHGASAPYTPVRARCESTPHHLAKGPGYVLYAVMDYVVDQFFPVVEFLEVQLEVLEEEVFASRGKTDRGTMARIYSLKRDVVSLKRAVSPLIDVCNRLERLDDILLAEGTRLYFRDVYDHVIRVNENIEHLRELLSTVLEANLSLVSVQQNDVTKRLASWAAIIAVPTAIAGVYGMNFDNMPELRQPYGYPTVMAVMAAICGGLYWRLRKAGWL